MDYITYNGKQYKSFELELNGEYFCYAEASLSDDMEQNNDLGCSLDDEICYYPEEDELDGLAKLVEAGATEKEIIEYCYNNAIYIGDYTVEQVWVEDKNNPNVKVLKPYSEVIG